MLALGTAAQTAGTVFVTTPAFLIPVLRRTGSLTLPQAGLLASAPTFGIVLTLVAWGALADRIGERWVISVGLGLTALAATGAVLSPGYPALAIFLVLGGMAAGSANAASGRVVVGWFPKHRRGLAMGVRQMAQPLGTTVAALVVPTLAASSVPSALAVSAVTTAVLAGVCAVGIVNPPARRLEEGEAPAASPYRGSSFLWRIHAVSMLLVVPQYALALFGLVWLVSELGWSSLAAGALIGASQFVGALGRIGAGLLSDRVGSRVRPLRWIAVGVCVSMLALAGFDALGWQAAAVVLVVATTMSVADNGLAFTSVAEAAGPRWAGRALGVQNTGQFLTAAAVGPLFGGLVSVVGYPASFAACAVAPVVAVTLLPRVKDEHDRL
ncbi:MFS transporter [Microlunatus flavus]|uniref:Sugar phosphate permease n=1 Tax=Microlunatus flavus TaxID=1036181 RepID=A0A1H9JIP9_9ACTN|nr:MFS transporter [Microlunatus flavus]SEQ86851.1 Sugar phosphate permease [Microlunatus flavus]